MPSLGSLILANAEAPVVPSLPQGVVDAGEDALLLWIATFGPAVVFFLIVSGLILGFCRRLELRLILLGLVFGVAGTMFASLTSTAVAPAMVMMRLAVVMVLGGMLIAVFEKWSDKANSIASNQEPPSPPGSSASASPQVGSPAGQGGES